MWKVELKFSKSLENLWLSSETLKNFWIFWTKALLVLNMLGNPTPSEALPLQANSVIIDKTADKINAITNNDKILIIQILEKLKPKVIKQIWEEILGNTNPEVEILEDWNWIMINGILYWNSIEE